MNKKLVRNVLVLTLAAVVLVTATVFTTMAYLLSSAKVSNVFTVGNVAIEMFETKVDKQGVPLVPIDPENPVKKTADSNSYELIPGRSYTKDPTIYIQSGSQPSLLFAKIKNQISPLEVDPVTGPKDTMREQMEKNGWMRIGVGKNGDWIYVFTGSKTPIADRIDDFNSVVKVVPATTKETSVDLFNEFTLDANCNDKPEFSQAGSFEVTITAYAIQDTFFKTDSNSYLTVAEIANAWKHVTEHNINEAGNAFTEEVMLAFLAEHYPSTSSVE